jgi:hypothetical protein
MKNLILLSIIQISLLILFSCSPGYNTRYEKTSNLELRQLVNLSEENTTISRSGIFFSTYYSHSEDRDYVKVFAKVDGSYRFLKLPIEVIRIKLDSTVMNPYIIVNYSYSSNKDEKYSDTYVLDGDNYDTYIDNYTIVCNEMYLPENLLPIDLTK